MASFYINPKTGIDNDRVPGSRANPLRTLTYALTKRVLSGDEVKLAPGTYSLATGESFPIVIPSGVTVKASEDSKGRDVLIEGGGRYTSPSSARYGFNVTFAIEKNSQLQDVTVSNTNLRGTGVWIESPSIKEAIAPTVTNCTFINCNMEGVFVAGAANPKILDSVFLGSKGYGISINAKAKGEIRSNRFERNTVAISTRDEVAPSIADNTIRENIRSGVIISGSSKPVLRNNRMQKNGDDGVVVIGQACPDLGNHKQRGGNVFTDNGINDLLTYFDLQNASSNRLVSYGNQLDPERVKGLVDFLDYKIVTYKLQGRLLNQATNAPLANFTVRAFDLDATPLKKLEDVITSSEGKFAIAYKLLLPIEGASSQQRRFWLSVCNPQGEELWQSEIRLRAGEEKPGDIQVSLEENLLDIPNKRLTMTGLGIAGDSPPNDFQPPLVDGIHLRWAFGFKRGFPGYGYYLFRRQYRGGNKVCLQQSIPYHFLPFAFDTKSFPTDFGILSSDKNLVLSDKFASGRNVQAIGNFDLEGRSYLRFDLNPGLLARRAEISIGFRHSKEQVGFYQVDSGPNPRIEQGVRFEVQFPSGTFPPQTRVVDWGWVGLDCGQQLEIELPRPASLVELLLKDYAVGFGPATIEIFNEDGTSAGTKETSSTEEPQRIILRGAAITRIVVQKPDNELLLRQFCYRPSVTSEEGQIQVRGLLEGAEVTQVNVTGQDDEKIVSATLEFEALSSVEITSGPASLIDLCWELSSDGGWEKVPDFPYPMRLPVTHPDYPCTLVMNENLSQARELARKRIQYGNPDRFTSVPAAYTTGKISVVKGSPVVKGMGTNWSEKLIGCVLQVSGDATAYTVMMLVSPDKLVLSRNYGGENHTDIAYTITDDVFGQLHDYLVHLVSKGSGSSSMSDRYLPIPAYAIGRIAVTAQSCDVQGINTQWSTDLEGLTLEVVADTAGNIRAINGSSDVRGIKTNWSENLAGMVLQVEGQREEYTITKVDSPTQLTLNQAYEGETVLVGNYTIVEQAIYTIAKVNSPTQLTLQQNYGGTTKKTTRYTIGCALQSIEPGGAPSRMPKQYPLDLILSGTLHPAIAQMLGLYWIDDKAEPGIEYEYVIVGDRTGIFCGNGEIALAYIKIWGLQVLQALVDFAKDPQPRKVEPAPPLPEPQDLRVYALPSSVAIPLNGGNIDLRQNVGLRWELPVSVQGEQRKLLPEAPVRYHLWRADLGEQEPTSAPANADYQPITDSEREPISVIPTFWPDAQELQRPPDFPPYPFHAIDGGLLDGQWYSYQICGVDIFGRHSPNSAPTKWYQWASVPSSRRWNYEHPPGEQLKPHFAIRLLDTTPPPPPTAIEAYALDPSDPTVLKDAAYKTWWNALTATAWYQALSEKQKKNLIGLRVRWQWTLAHSLQAPDTREFRIYYHPGQMNAVLGRIVAVRAISATESEVDVDVPASLGASQLVGAWLREGASAFKVIDSEIGSSCCLKVQNIELRANIGKISVEQGSAAVKGRDTSWSEDLAGMVLQVDGDSALYTIATVDSLTHLTLNKNYSGTTGGEKNYSLYKIPRAGVPCTFEIPPPVNSSQHPLFVDYGAATNWSDRIYVVGYDEHWSQPTDAGGNPLPFRQYEIFLPTPSGEFQAGLPLIASRIEPIVYAHIGISAADDKIYILDQRNTGDWSDRSGNEGIVGQPVKVFRVLREPPEPPVPPPADSDRVYATPANYHGQSFYTYRWQPDPPLKCHIFRALDDTLFQIDWARRVKSPDTIDASDDYFPVEWRGSDPSSVARREQIAKALNQLNAFLPAEGGKAQGVAYYRQLANDALRVLAGLPGNERAFAQVTVQPLDSEELDMEDPTQKRWRDRVGPDNPTTYQPKEKLRAYIDTLDGRSTNRYFYRVAYVDGAHNRSGLSLASPPVYLPDIVLPEKPQLLKVLGGHRRVILRWRAYQEKGLCRYLIYRTESKTDGRDIRLMGEPVANLPAVTLVALASEVDLGVGTDVSIIERVYAAEGFNFNADLLSGQSAEQYLAIPTVPVGTRVTGLTAPDGIPVVVVYRDSRQGLQHTYWGNEPRVWTDEGLLGGCTYYYRIIATRTGETANGTITLHSLPSDLVAGRAVDLTLPNPPTITSIEWVRISENDTIYPFTSPAPEGEVRYPAVHLVWTSSNPDLSCLVQFQMEPSSSFANASGWLPRGTYEFIHKNEFSFVEQTYRIRVVDRSGNANTVYATAILPPFKVKNEEIK
jgi:parallel beta-helix repeat protein